MLAKYKAETSPNRAEAEEEIVKVEARSNHAREGGIEFSSFLFLGLSNTQ